MPPAAAPAAARRQASAAPAAAVPRCVVFDVGQVLVGWNPRAFYTTVFGDGAAAAHFVDHIATPDWHAQHDAGRPFAETSAELIARHPMHAEAIRLWGDRFVDQLDAPTPAIRAIVAGLADRGVPLYAITNFSAEFWVPFAAREAALIAPFGDVVVSGEVGVMKPDPAIFALAIRRFGIAATDALFVDDRPENIAAAEACGMTGHLFADDAALRADLKRHGLL